MLLHRTGSLPSLRGTRSTAVRRLPRRFPWCRVNVTRLRAQAHMHSESSLGLAAIRNRGKLAWNIFILIKGFHFTISPLLFLSYHLTDPATGPFNPIAFLLNEVSLRYDLSNGQVGIPCWKGRFQCCSTGVGTRQDRAHNELQVRSCTHLSRQANTVFAVMSKQLFNKIFKASFRRKVRAKGCTGTLLLLPHCSIAHTLWTLYLKLNKPSADSFLQQHNATNTRLDWVLYFSPLFWTYNALSYSITWRLDVVCLSLWPVLLSILTISFFVQLTFESPVWFHRISPAF